jgi:hypothetical protein
MWNIIAPAVAGFAIDKLMGGSGIKGAAVGAGGGYLGAGKGANLGANFVNSGSALGQGGMNTLSGMNALGMNSAVNTGLGGLNTGLANVTGGVTGQGFSPYATPDVLGSSITGLESNLGLDTTNAILDPLTGQAVAPQFNSLPRLEDTPLYTGVETPNFANVTKSTPQEIAQQLATQGTGGEGLFDMNYISSFIPDEKDLGAMAVNMGVDALTPEQRLELEHQRAMVMRGQTDGLLGQGGYQGIGGSYILRA